MKLDSVRYWDLFLCYRQSDGKDVAELLYEVLNGAIVDIEEPQYSTAPRIRVYFDQTAPAVEDWESVHRPALDRARTLIFICSPGASTRFSKADWVHRELRWWLKSNKGAPIIIETTSDSRYIPRYILQRWPKAQRIAVTPSDTRIFDTDRRISFSERIRLRIVEGLKVSWENRQADAILARRAVLRRKRMLVCSMVALSVTMALALSGIATFNNGWARYHYLTSPQAALAEVPLEDAFNLDGTVIATASVDSIDESVEDVDYHVRAVNLWSVGSGRLIQTIQLDGNDIVHTAALSSDGTVLASGSENGGVVVYGTKPVHVIVRLSSKERSAQVCTVQKIVFSDAAKSLAWGDSCNWIHYWAVGSSADNVKSVRLPARQVDGIRPGIRQLSFDRQGTRLVVLSLDIWPRLIYVYDLRKNDFFSTELVKKQQSIVGLISVAVTDTGTLLALFDDQVNGMLVYDIQKGQEIARLPPPHRAGIYFATPSRTAEAIAGATNLDSICFWRRERDGYVISGEIQDAVKSVSVSPNGGAVAAHAGQGTVLYRHGIRIWGVLFKF